LQCAGRETRNQAAARHLPSCAGRVDRAECVPPSCIADGASSGSSNNGRVLLSRRVGFGTDNHTRKPGPHRDHRRTFSVLQYRNGRGDWRKVLETL
jgi:hypothetical protein